MSSIAQNRSGRMCPCSSETKAAEASLRIRRGMCNMRKNKEIENSQVQRAEGTWPFGPIVLSTRTTVAPELTENAPAPTSACSQALLAYFENKNAQIGEEACKQFRTVLFVMQHCLRLALLLLESASAPPSCHTSTPSNSLPCTTPKAPCLTSSMRSHAQSSRANSQEPDVLHRAPHGHSLSKLCCQ